MQDLRKHQKSWKQVLDSISGTFHELRREIRQTLVHKNDERRETSKAKKEAKREGEEELEGME